MGLSRSWRFACSALRKRAAVLVTAVLTVIFAGAFYISSLHAQSPSPPQTTPPQIAPTLKIEVRVVLLDVVVTNKKGQPVTGLPKEAFSVAEDGAPQAVSFFEEHRDTPPTPNASTAQPAPNPPEPLPPNTYTSSQIVKPSDSVNVLLLDWLNTQPHDQAYVREQVIKYLRTVAPGTRLAIFALGTELRIVQGFTSESAVLLAALNGKNGSALPKSQGLLATESQHASDNSIIEMMIGNNASPVAIASVRESQRDTTVKQTADRAKLTLDALKELERYLSVIPGRKNVFWFSGSFPVNIFPGAGPASGFQLQLERTAEQLGPDRIAIYPISAQGAMEAPSLDPSVGLNTRAGARLAGGSGDAADTTPGNNQAAMETLAKETGGAAFYNTNGLEGEISHAVDEAAHYYTLTYSPTNAQKDGKFRNIQVKLADGNYKLSYRHGYFTEGANAAQAAAAAKPPSGNDPLLGLMRFGMPDFDQIAYRVHIAPVQPQPAAGAARAGVNADLKGPLTRYSVDFTIPLRGLALKASDDGARHGLIELMLVAYEKNGFPLNMVVSKNEVSLPQKVYESSQNIEIHARQDIDLPEGSIYLRAGLYEQATGNVGTIEISVNNVPPPPAANPPSHSAQ